MMDDDPLISDIDAFLARSGMSATAFGLAVAKDATLVSDLRNGRDVRRSMERKIRSWIEERSGE